jgi:colicin import membrane protein
MFKMINADRMTTRGIKAAVVLFFALVATASLGQAVPGQGREKVTDRFLSGSIRSVAEADAALSEAAAERSEIEARYVVEEQACHPNFFTTSCIQKAKDRRRIALAALRPIEIEANAFKRKARVAERDQALMERLEKDERQRLERESRVPAAELAPAAVNKEEPLQKAQPTNDLAAEKTLPTEKSQPSAVKRQKAEDPISAEKRAANIAAYEKKKRDALERQQKVAQRKAEKEQKRKEKQAETANPG